MIVTGIHGNICICSFWVLRFSRWRSTSTFHIWATDRSETVYLSKGDEAGLQTCVGNMIWVLSSGVVLGREFGPKSLSCRWSSRSCGKSRLCKESCGHLATLKCVSCRMWVTGSGGHESVVVTARSTDHRDNPASPCTTPTSAY